MIPDDLRNLGLTYFDEQDGVAPGWRNTRAESAEARVVELEQRNTHLAIENQTRMDISCNACDDEFEIAMRGKLP